MGTVAETFPLEELRKKAQHIVGKNPDIETDVRILSALVLGQKYRDEVIAYLVEGKTDDSNKTISDIEKYRDETYRWICDKPLKIQLVDYSFIGNSPGEHIPNTMQSSEDYDDSESRRRIARMIGLKEVPDKDPDAIRRLKGKIKIESIAKDFDSVEEIRSVREAWTSYQ